MFGFLSNEQDFKMIMGLCNGCGIYTIADLELFTQREKVENLQDLIFKLFDYRVELVLGK